MLSDWTTDTNPALLRIAATTIATPDLDASERGYAQWLDYRTIERGRVSLGLATSWGAPAAAGARCCTMVPEAESDVFMRLVEVPGSPTGRPLTSFGWTAFEMIVDDVHALAERLASAPFERLGGPRPLQFMPSIVAMQVAGPAGECLYFTMESGDRATSILPPPSGFVGRTFIVVAAGKEGDFEAMRQWYVDRFGLRGRPIRQSQVAVVQHAQGLDPDRAIPLTTVGLQQHGNLIELDGYPVGPGLIAGPRPGAPGHLPPGNAMVSFEVADLEPYIALAAAVPMAHAEALYGGRRSCTLLGPAGELLELIEVS